MSALAASLEAVVVWVDSWPSGKEASRGEGGGKLSSSHPFFSQLRSLESQKWTYGVQQRLRSRSKSRHCKGLSYPSERIDGGGGGKARRRRGELALAQEGVDWTSPREVSLGRKVGVRSEKE